MKVKKLFQRAFTAYAEMPNVFVRVLTSYTGFVLLNFLLFYAGIPGKLTAFLFDIIVGLYILYESSRRERLIRIISEISKGDFKSEIDLKDYRGNNIKFAVSVCEIGDSFRDTVERSIKNEKLKADLITNVSHDLRTPLTSIVNYSLLLKREKSDNPRIRQYIDILEEKSMKLKSLTEDLVEASKISSGSISLCMREIDFAELIKQNIGEFYDRFQDKNLKPVFLAKDKKELIYADPAKLTRVVDNLFGNACKYALPGTIIHMDMKDTGDDKIVFTIRNMSHKEVTCDEEELTERFTRGDEFRTTEGFGLGLSIARNLTHAMEGDFNVKKEGGVFKVSLGLKKVGTRL